MLLLATFALLGKMLYLKLLFIAVDKGVLKGSEAIFIKLKELYFCLVNLFRVWFFIRSLPYGS